MKNLPGVGWKLGKKLKEKGISTCGELWAFPEPVLSVSECTREWMD